MNLTVTIDGQNRTSKISWPGFSIVDNKDNLANTCKFRIKKHAGQTWGPATGDTVNVTDGATTIFDGTILRIKKSVQAAHMEIWDIEAVDHTHELQGIMIIESFTNQTVTQIIDFINDNYLWPYSYTITNVNCDINIPSVKFDHISAAAAIDKLAKMVGWSWDVDYVKDIHFYNVNTETAPFNLDDTGGKYVFDSLQITEDITQIRNIIRVRGGTITGSSRSEFKSGDGTNKIFPLANKFSSKPTLKVGGVTKVVGAENVEVETGKDAMWDFNEKSLRFINAPASGTANIEVTGTPLFAIIVQVQDDASIAAHGERWFYKKDTTIKSKEEGRDVAIGELTAYKNAINEGSFRTETSGLKSGQTITISSTIRGMAATDFLIQSVNLRLTGPNTGEWNIQLATLRTIGIIKLLQDKLLREIGLAQESDEEAIEKYYIDHKEIQVTEQITGGWETEDHQTVQVAEQIRKDPWTPEFVLGPYTPTGDADNKRVMRLNTSSYVY